MAENSAIEWCDHTWSPWEGCTKVSPACDNCYAAARNARFSRGANWGPGAPRRLTADWTKPALWNRQAAKAGERATVFPSICDPFDNEVPAEWRTRFYELCNATPHLTWLLLTKRIGNVKAMAEHGLFTTLPNVWLGVTVIDQAEADRDIPKLLATPARVRFLSIEPMLGPIDLTRIELHKGPIKLAAEAPAEWRGVREVAVVMNALKGSKQIGMAPLSWVICGGESGPQARPMHPDWARSLREQCQSAGVPFLFKQWGEWGPDWEGAETCSACGRTKFDAINSHGECGHCGIDGWMSAEKPLDKPRRVGKKAAGRLLDGRTHDDFPLTKLQAAKKEAREPSLFPPT